MASNSCTRVRASAASWYTEGGFKTACTSQSMHCTAAPTLAVPVIGRAYRDGYEGGETHAKHRDTSVRR